MADPNYVVGRGKLYFHKFLAGTRTLDPDLGARYLGNSPELSLSQSEEKLDHYSSDAGIRVKDASVSLQNDMSGSFNLDDIQNENLALWFRGETQASAIAGGAVVDELHVANKGSFIQLGLSPTEHVGARNVSAVNIVNATQADAVVAAATNWELDAVTGRIYILPDAPDIDEADDLEIDYTAAAGTENIVIAAGETIEGRLEFISDNAAGANKDYIWPCVQVAPDGDFSLKGDDWQNMTFTFEVIKLNDSTERQYIVNR